MLIRMDVVRPELTRVIRGSGVDLERFVPAPVPSGMPVIMLASRMLWEKGVGEFASAAEVCLRQGLRAKFVLVGEPDPDRISASVPVTQIRSWVQAGLVEWWGKQTDMAATLSQASVVCLPSYWEGLPKVLIEAAACGRALVASDIPGCREIAREGVNALLVPVGDAQALAHAISRLVKDPALRGRMGEESRKIAVEAFSDVQVANEIVSVYSELFSGHVSDLPVTEVSSL
jgi:glycosyltransferase involved in cell wall biosynthesis